MRNLRVLILLSAVLVLSGVVFTSTTAFASNSTKSAVVLECRENAGTIQVSVVSPLDICGIGPIVGNGTTINDCANAIATLLNNGCKLENSFAPSNADDISESLYLFICRGTGCSQ